MIDRNAPTLPAPALLSDDEVDLVLELLLADDFALELEAAS